MKTRMSYGALLKSAIPTPQNLLDTAMKSKFRGVHHLCSHVANFMLTRSIGPAKF